MFRLLPYLIICLVILIGSKALSILDYSPKLLKVTEVRAEGKQEATKEEAIAHDEHGGAKAEKKEDKKEESVVQMGPNLCEYSPIEVEILQSLKKRREEIDKREQEISLKENSLNVLAKNIDRKVDSLSKLQADLKQLLEKYEEKRAHEVSALVKIYENMKPKDAARIFDTLELGILLEVSSNMKEVKLAPIIATMDPDKARLLTIEIANHNRIVPENY